MMTRIALAQLNPAVGDLRGNAGKMGRAFARATDRGADIIVFPAGALSGAPVGGLAEDGDFLSQGRTLLAALERECAGRAFFKEIFRPCLSPAMDRGVVVRSSASRYCRGGPAEQWETGGRHAAANGVWLVDCNLAGGQDDHVFPGGSFVAGPGGDIWTAPLFVEDLVIFDLGKALGTGFDPGDANLCQGNDGPIRRSSVSSLPDPGGETACVYAALTLAIRDYVSKCRLAGAAVSVSGGVDSALVAAMAVDALGPGRVACLTLPGPFTSPETLEDARSLAANLSVEIEETSIVPAYEAARAALRGILADGPPDPEDLAGQNIQARLRGMYLMALANRRGLLALNCSNKSEGMVGYGTLYGDMVGGFAPLRDVWKTEVWELSRHANALAGRERIPARVIGRVPSAELRHGQEDRQSIPDYPILDALLGAFVDSGVPYSGLAARGFAEEDARKAVRLNYASSFKRRQAPFGPVITRTALAAREPMPVVNGFMPWLPDSGF